MGNEKRSVGRPSLNTKSYHVKIEGDLAKVLDLQNNKNRFINEAVRMKMVQEGLLEVPKAMG